MPLFLGDQIVAGNANATDTDKKIFLIGATEQTEDSETFSHDTVYVGEDGFLYINGEKAVRSSEIPTKISAFTNDAEYATTNEVKQEIANLVNSAPDKLNTLDELAAALGDDENFANTVATELSKKLNKAEKPHYHVEDVFTPGENPLDIYDSTTAMLVSDVPPVCDGETGTYSFSEDAGVTESTVGDFSLDPYTKGLLYGIVDGVNNLYYIVANGVSPISTFAAPPTTYLSIYYKVEPLITEVAALEKESFYIKDLHFNNIQGSEIIADIIEDRDGNVLSNKQNRLTGETTQLVGFDSEGNASVLDKSVVFADYLPLAGGTMSGDIAFVNSGAIFSATTTISGSPIKAGRIFAGIPEYDTGLDENGVPGTTTLSKPKLQSDSALHAPGFNALNNTIQGVAEPVYAYDAANKEYVDRKQNKITGTAGQVVGFGSDGNPIAQNTQQFIFWENSENLPDVVEGAILIVYGE